MGWHTQRTRSARQLRTRTLNFPGRRGRAPTWPRRRASTSRYLCARVAPLLRASSARRTDLRDQCRPPGQHIAGVAQHGDPRGERAGSAHLARSTIVGLADSIRVLGLTTQLYWLGEITELRVLALTFTHCSYTCLNTPFSQVFTCVNISLRSCFCSMLTLFHIRGSPTTQRE